MEFYLEYNSLDTQIIDFQDSVTIFNHNTSDPKDLKSCLKNFSNRKKTTKSSLKADNFRRSIEKYSIKVIKLILEYKQIKDSKMVYNIENKGSTELRTILESNVLMHRRELLSIINDYKQKKSNAGKKQVLSQSQTFLDVYSIIVDLIFYSYKEQDPQIIEPEELNERLKIDCCGGGHSLRCHEIWREIKVALKTINIPGNNTRNLGNGKDFEDVLECLLDL